MRQKENSISSKVSKDNPFRKLFKKQALLKAALTHPSAGERDLQKSAFNFQRLEFLGDAVLGLVITHELFTQKPNAQEGELSHDRSSLVSRNELARRAEAIGLSRWIKISGQTNETSPKILADTLEALIGAIYIDKGLKGAKNFIEKLFTKKRKQTALPGAVINNPKGMLQELIQKEWHTLPVYKTTPHKKGFRTDLIIPMGKSIGIARSKKNSQEAAALKILPRLQKYLKTRANSNE